MRKLKLTQAQIDDYYRRMAERDANFLPMLQKAIEADGYSKETAAEVVQKLSND